MEETGRVRRVRVFAVDTAGNDLLGRPVPEGALSRARELAAESGQRRAAQVVAAPGGESYLLFVPHTALAPPPPPLPLSPWMLIVIGAATSLAVSAILAWYLARPIRSLRWAFDAAAGGRLETRVRPLMGRRRDEIADLGRDFDRMAQQLQKLVSAQRRLLHDVSHELRSPLARLQAAIGLVRQSPQKLDASLQRIERGATRLSELVGEVLTLARLESVNPAAEPVELADVVASVAEDARFEAQAAGRDVSFHGVGGAIVRGRAELLHRAVENVVRNAVKYTAPGSTVDIAMCLERSEEHTSELQSQSNLVCRLLLEKKTAHDHAEKVLESPANRGMGGRVDAPSRPPARRTLTPAVLLATAFMAVCAVVSIGLVAAHR